MVVATGRRSEFGAVAAGLSEHQLDTAFQAGLRRFSMLLVYVAAVLTTSIFVINVALHKPTLDALLFSLAIAVGITPQLLPAVVSTSLAAGARRMNKRKVLVKRLVCIEDLGDVDTLFTDKTGTLTQGRISYMRAVPVGSTSPERLLQWGLLCTETSMTSTSRVTVAGGNALDTALWASSAAESEGAGLARFTRVALLPFDHERRMASVCVRDESHQMRMITKGAPEDVLSRCVEPSPAARAALDAEFAAGNRVVAVATKTTRRAAITLDDEKGLTLAGLLVFRDPPKPHADDALRRLAGLGVSVKVVTGDNPAVAAKACADLGLPDGDALTGSDVDALDDAQLAHAMVRTTIFARVTPEQKARIVRLQRKTGGDVAFLGDGVNDALALHAADVGISVESATDVAKDAADVILLEKDLSVLADGVAEGRRIFANTIKYVLMGTSSNFGNMSSAAGASVFLSFLPMLPGQILLNNLLYDSSQLAIPTDHVDEEQLRKPSHWDIGFIRRFMIFFGPISSLFDFATFGVMLWVFHSGPAQFRTGWFVESLATQALVIFVIRTRRTPFWRSRPSPTVALSALLAVAVGVAIPASPMASALGFRPLPVLYYAVLAGMVCVYLATMDAGKRLFFRIPPVAPEQARPVLRDRPQRRLHRRASHFSTAGTTTSSPEAGREPPAALIAGPGPVTGGWSSRTS